MPTVPRYWYEITYEVSPERRDEYDRWLPEAMIGWLERSEVEVFQAYRRETGSGGELKLVFQFDDRETWTSFVGSDVHVTNIERLRALAASVDEGLWKPSVIPLNAEKSAEAARIADSAFEDAEEQP
jgi:hypothetical protein